MINVEELFVKHNDEYLEWDKVEDKKSTRRDLHAFLLLNEICPGEMNIIAGAEHDVIFLDVDLEDLESATEEQIIELIRCGVISNDEYGCLSMFV